MNIKKIVYLSMRKIIPLFMLGSLLLLTSCLSKVVPLQDPYNKSIDVFITKSPDKDFTEEFFIQVNGNIFETYADMLDKVKAKAQEKGCDAVANISFQKIDFVNLYGLITIHYPRIEAVALKYVKK